MHHGKNRGNEIRVKYVKTRQFYEIRGEFCKSRGERKNFPKIGEMSWNREMEGIIRNLWWMTKKKSSEILAAENREIFWRKVKLGKFSAESEKFLGNRGQIWNRRNASLPQGGWTLLPAGSGAEPQKIARFWTFHAKWGTFSALVNLVFYSNQIEKYIKPRYMKIFRHTGASSECKAWCINASWSK